ncbi:FAD-dependent oxidoreductase [Roseateles sp. SL47]|uniref:flavin monoamine oxidase family protein n=1 Tax=Roseateles sp. SL47 TaxID=2995138 RepID=UPI0022700D2B|nr:FAD-dependent oxidoreductase [Roseateles sp. SL47]WAC74597.1 FAD-dependent oxidoreductase [Roseateles sp. SL47]
MLPSNITPGEGASRLSSQAQPLPARNTAGDVRSGQGPGIHPTGGPTSTSGTQRSRGSGFAAPFRGLIGSGRGNESAPSADGQVHEFPVVGKPPTASSFPATINLKGHVKLPLSSTLRRLTSPRSLSDLNTNGRALPRITPQTLGRYISGVVGEWDGLRADLVSRIVTNLGELDRTTDNQVARQLHMEIALHFNCLCEPEKVELFNTLVESHRGLLTDNGRVTRLVEHMLLATPAPNAAAMRAACRGETQGVLSRLFDKAGNVALLEKDFAEFSMTQPLDHMFDYGGFMEATQRVYGTLPEGVAARHRVCVVGAGPAGIMAADGLNRLGVKVHVFEQGDQIGGRLKTVRLPPSGRAVEPDRPPSPTPMEMGGMRFAPFEGNSFYRLIQLYQLPNAPFPNPSRVHGSLVIGQEVVETRPGEKPDHPLLAEVTREYEKAMEPLLGPIRAARAAGDTLKFRELCEAAIERFDPMNFQVGLRALLKDQGIEWSPEKWELYGAVGIGVGGYEGYYGTGFLEEFKFLADKRLENHVFLPGGANSVLEAVASDENIPSGRPSLDAQQAIELNTAVEQILKKTDPDTGEAFYEVTVQHTENGVETKRTERFTEVIFAAGPSEAIRLGLTGPQADSDALMTPELGKALRHANLVGATKLAVKVPREMLDQYEKDYGIPGNIQSSHPFQQVYVLPAISKTATSRVIFLSYQLGDNATKTASMGGEEQFRLFTSILRNTALAQPDNPAYQKLERFAELVEAGKDRMAFEPWSLERHFGGAFKMDRPMEQGNTQRMWESTLDRSSTGAIFVNEMMTAEGGFASGAVSAAINGVQQFIVRNDGELAPNSPLDQERLYPMS